MFVYLDDVLMLGARREEVEELARFFASSLSDLSLVVSVKSVLCPTQCIKWLGKEFDLRGRSVSNLPSTLERCLAGVVWACFMPLSLKQLDGLLGLLNWVFQPRPGFGLFAGYLYGFKDKRKRVGLLP